jgi:hypothetical protein
MRSKIYTNQIIQQFDHETDEIMPEIDTLETVKKWCLCAEKGNKSGAAFNDKKFLIQKLQAMRLEHSTQLLRPFIALGTKSRARLMDKIKHNHDCFFKLTQGAETAINNDKLILACHMLLYAGRLNERARILPYDDVIATGIKTIQGAQDAAELLEKKSDPAKMKAFIDKYFKDNPSCKSFTRAVIACAKVFKCSTKTIYRSVSNDYTNIK